MLPRASITPSEEPPLTEAGTPSSPSQVPTGGSVQPTLQTGLLLDPILSEVPQTQVVAENLSGDLSSEPETDKMLRDAEERAEQHGPFTPGAAAAHGVLELSGPCSQNPGLGGETWKEPEAPSRGASLSQEGHREFFIGFQEPEGAEGGGARHGSGPLRKRLSLRARTNTARPAVVPRANSPFVPGLASTFRLTDS